MFTQVPFLPSNNAFKEALEYLEIKKGDNVIDIGSGNGKVLLWASRHYPDANFVGVEKNCILVLFSNIKANILRRKNLKFICKNIFEYDISSFNKIYMFLTASFIDKVMQMKEDEIKSGCMVISFHFPMGHNFHTTHKITKYPVKYMKEYIFKWVK
jgi:16S rRNA A1518/A1519 N6-dimethyltransferase RsmA/KsgA/DIM1 with predicted DNA glycosylase/AP lyase activity